MAAVFDSDMAGLPLAQVREKVNALALTSPNGVVCPCCEGVVNTRAERMGTVLAKTLLWIVDRHKQGHEWVHCRGEHVPRWMIEDNTGGKLRYWDLVTRENGRKGDAVQPTQLGLDFALGKIPLYFTAYVRNDKVIAFAPNPTGRINDLMDDVTPTYKDLMNKGSWVV